MDYLAARLPHADRDHLAAIAETVGTEIETLAGQRFGPRNTGRTALASDWAAVADLHPF